MRFVARGEWGARSPANRSRIGDVRGVTIHWNGPGIGAHDHGECFSIMRGFQDYHMDSHGWSDIGYNAVACIHGYVFEGRGVGVRGAHTGASNIGGNSDWYGLQAMVGVGDALTPELINALSDGIAWFRRNGAGDRVNAHRDHHSTACPGGGLYRWAHGGSVSTVPTESEEEEDMLRRGVKSEAVQQWQQALQRYFWYQGIEALPEFGADSDFGNETVVWTNKWAGEVGLAHGMVTTMHWLVMGLVLHRRDDPATVVGEGQPVRRDDRSLMDFAWFNRRDVRALQSRIDSIASGVGVDVDEEAIANRVIAALSPDKVAELVVSNLSSELAADVVDELNERLAV